MLQPRALWACFGPLGRARVDELFGDVHESAVPAGALALQQGACGLGGDAVTFHEDALGLADEVAALDGGLELPDGLALLVEQCVGRCRVIAAEDGRVVAGRDRWMIRGAA